jgi:hypothetical protein
MDPVESWIDAEAVRRMARELLSPSDAAEPLEPPEDTGFGPDFEGFVTPGERPTPPDPSPATSSVSAATAPSSPPPEAPQLPPVAATGDAPPPPETDVARPFLSAEQPPPDVPARRRPLISRLERYRDWLHEKSGVHGVFILDRDGDPVLEDPAYGKLHFLARSLSQAYRPVEGEPGNVHVKIGAESYLSVIPVDTDFGRLVLGIVLAKPLNAEAVAVVTRVLGEAARPERSSGSGTD